ncbi:hypothetical protein M426DRAFT_16854 [Hypoxylon sp. CI-4A]|nr:hypothetical protein M426DRAFT_16854 [Hypoxylon sp. CI-4A]
MTMDNMQAEETRQRSDRPPLTPLNATSFGGTVSYSTTSSNGIPKHTVSHDEATLVQVTEPRNRGITVLTERDCPEALAFEWSSAKKWRVSIIIFLVQISMNLNTSLYANGQKGIEEHFGVSSQSAVSGAGIFLVFYAFGCELWAPWSEEFGRKLILQFSLLLVNLCCLPVALAPHFSAILAGRALGGLFSAGGSVTLGVIADMYKVSDQEKPLAFIVLSSVGGSIIGPIVGGFIQEYLFWTWTIWTQLIFGIFVQVLHFFLVPETRATVLVDHHAKKMRKARLEETGEKLEVFGPTETKTWREYMVPGELSALWFRPFIMFVTEPIVSVLSSLSGFSDALIFMQIQSLDRVFRVWNFTTTETGLAFIPLGIGYLLGYLSFLLVIPRNQALRAKRPQNDHAQYESRLWWLLFTSPCLPIGLLIFSWTITPSGHWIGPMFGCLLIGIANYTIYMTTVDYMVAAYGPYSASATGGNGFARDFLAGILTWAAVPYYNAFAMEHGLQIANTVLACISLLLVVATFAVYYKGPSMRKRSPFAQSLSQGVAGTMTEIPPTATI